MTAAPGALEGEVIRTCQRAVRRRELRKIVPLADTTIYEMERRGDFPRRFYLTSKCVVWDLDEVEQWLTAKREACPLGSEQPNHYPNVRCRRRRPCRSAGELESEQRTRIIR
ncbi:MAG: AlpA family phage regulatory protein [Steroidobacteraceae bacterium]